MSSWVNNPGVHHGGSVDHNPCGIVAIRLHQTPPGTYKRSCCLSTSFGKCWKDLAQCFFEQLHGFGCWDGHHQKPCCGSNGQKVRLVLARRQTRLGPRTDFVRRLDCAGVRVLIQLAAPDDFLDPTSLNEPSLRQFVALCDRVPGARMPQQQDAQHQTKTSRTSNAK